jgi:hypothetical protein
LPCKRIPKFSLPLEIGGITGGEHVDRLSAGFAVE